MVEFRVLRDEVLEVGDDCVIFIAFGVVGWDRGEFWGGVEAGNAATVASGGSGGGSIRLLAAGTRVGLAAGASALVEEGSVDFGDDEAVGVAEVEGGGGGGGEEGEGLEV